jgi:putative transposase
VELNNDQAFVCFHYIQQNPLKAGLCSQMQDWSFSSFGVYIDLPSVLTCKKEIAYGFLEIPREPEKFIQQSRDVVIDEKVLGQIM